MKAFFVIGSIYGFLAVALGAFGAHGLEGKVSEKALDAWEKAVKYQMFHTGALLATSILLLKENSTALVSAGWLFIVGTLLFSGSLYFYSTLGIRSLAMITPIGGVVFLIGCVFFGIAVSKLF